MMAARAEAVPQRMAADDSGPERAARRFAEQALGRRYERLILHTYTDGDGKPLYWRIRVRLPDGSKWIRPMRRDGERFALGEPAFGENGKPLYRLQELMAADASAPVWFVEGEGCADAIARLGLLATTAGGASSDEHAAFAPLRGRHVIVWPDADDAGRAHGERVARKLLAIQCDVEVIDVAALGLPDGGDCVDWLRAHPGATAHDLQSLPRRPAAACATALAESELAHPALEPEAFHGLAGEIVRAIEPDSEADPAAILLQTLVAFGALVGRGPHYQVEADEHHGNLFVLLVGATAKGRKGTSWGRVRQIFERVPDWPRVIDGLSSGEGLKWAVRDAHGDDAGVADKRLLVLESEFSQVLRQCQRNGNTLSATLRAAWESGRLMTTTKNDPATATGAHICVVGHVTASELVAELSTVDLNNGLTNRFILACVRRSKVLPFGGRPMPDRVVAGFAERLARAAAKARTRGAVPMTDEARSMWASVYPTLSAGRPGLLGAATARAEAQTIRLALLFALLDEAAAIDGDHLEAALAIWEYAEASAAFVFGDATGDSVADAIRNALRAAGAKGLTRTEIRDLFARNATATRIDAALQLLERHGLAVRQALQHASGGRPAEVWCGR